LRLEIELFILKLTLTIFLNTTKTYNFIVQFILNEYIETYIILLSS